MGSRRCGYKGSRFAGAITRWRTEDTDTSVHGLGVKITRWGAEDVDTKVHGLAVELPGGGSSGGTVRDGPDGRLGWPGDQGSKKKRNLHLEVRKNYN